MSRVIPPPLALAPSSGDFQVPWNVPAPTVLLELPAVESNMSLSDLHPNPAEKYRLRMGPYTMVINYQNSVAVLNLSKLPVSSRPELKTMLVMVENSNSWQVFRLKIGRAHV